MLLSPADMLPGTSVVWRDAAQLPLALLTADMRDRQVIDAVRRCGLGDLSRNRFRCFAVRTEWQPGNWAYIVHYLAMGNANERADGVNPRGQLVDC